MRLGLACTERFKPKALVFYADWFGIELKHRSISAMRTAYADAETAGIAQSEIEQGRVAHPAKG